MGNARNAALAGLKALRINGTWPDKFVQQDLSKYELDARDSGLAVALLYGTLEHRNLIDFYLEQYSSIKLKKIMPQVLDCLRLGIYQLIWMEKIPDHATVSEMVRLARKSGGDRAGSFCNAVLRKISLEKSNLPAVPKENFAHYLAVEYTHPEWFTEKMTAILGKEEAEMLCRANESHEEVTLRVNTLKITAPRLKELLIQKEIEVSEHRFLPHCLVVQNGGDLTKLPEFEQGLFYIQDIASQLAAWALGVKPGQNVIDLCAAPGGKTMIAAQMQQGKGDLLAIDVHEFKCKELQKTAKRYGVEHFKTACADSSVMNPSLRDTADRVICDVPCSGMGIIRKKADIRFKTAEEVREMPPLQRKILECAAAYCVLGGSIVYSTCTILPEENEQVVKDFLAGHPEFSAEAFELPGFGLIEEGQRTFYPHRDGTDGFYIAKLKKEALL